MRLVFLCLLVLFMAAGGLQAGQQPAAPQEAPAMQDTLPPAHGTGPVAVPQASEKAMHYYRSGNILWFVNVIWGLLVPAVFLFTGFSAKIRNWAARLGRKWFFVIAIYFVIFSAITFVLDLPLSYYQEFIRQHAYDLSNQTAAKWWGDAFKSLAVGLIMGVAFLWVPYLLLKKSPTRWWLYTGLLSIPFMLFVFLVSPVWIDPLFNDFGPMKDKALESRILALADRAGIEGGRVYEVNKSVDTKMVNAYVTGFGATKRIVLWDTIIAKLDEDELLFVMGHEMGHYVLNHMWKYIFIFSGIIILMLYVAYRAAGAVLARFKDRFGFDHLHDIASLPLIILLVNLISLVITPVIMGTTRHYEHQADQFGLEITRNNHAAATAFAKLQSENLSNPYPGLAYKLWRSSHPPLGERIEYCNTYKPWETGQPLAFDKLFH